MDSTLMYINDVPRHLGTSALTRLIFAEGILLLLNYLWKISGSPNLLFGFRLPSQTSAPPSHERRKNTSTPINLILYKMIKIFIADHKKSL